MNNVRTAVFLLALVCCSKLAMAQKSGEVGPKLFKFGDVYQGAIVEGCFWVFDAANDPNVTFDVATPPCVKLLRKTTSTVKGRRSKDIVEGVVSFRVDTANVGEVSGEFEVTLGSSKVSVPISATIKPAKDGVPRVLVAETPFNMTIDGNQLKVWTDLVHDAALDVNYLSTQGGPLVLRDLDLAKYQCVILSDDGLVQLTQTEARRLREYVERGGKLIVAANWFHMETIPKANEILEGSAIRFQDTEAKDEPQRHASFDESDLSSVLTDAGIKSARFYRASPISVTDERAGQVLVKAKGVGYQADGFVASAELGKGQIIAIGESSWWYWISRPDAAGTDNAALMRWMIAPQK